MDDKADMGIVDVDVDDEADMGIGMLKTLCLHRCDTCALSISVKFDKVDKSNRNRNTFTNINTNTNEENTFSKALLVSL